MGRCVSATHSVIGHQATSHGPYTDVVLVPVLFPPEVVFLFLVFTADVYARAVLGLVPFLVRIANIT